MVRWMRSMRVKATKGARAMQYAKEIAEFCKKYKSLPPIRVFFDAFGAGPVIRWCVDYEDLGALEKAHAEVLADEAYHKRLTEVADLFIEGTMEDVVMREL